MTMSLHLTQMHHVLRDYKDGRIDVRERFTLQLAALSTVVLLQHGACLGPWDDGTTIPSVRRNAPLTVLTRVPPSLYGEHRAVLTPRRADFGRDVDASRFTVSGDVQGDRVLLFEDTFVSGGATFSATAALRAAGATVVGPLIIGRHVRADWAPSVEMLSWLRAVPWSEDTCARCGGAGQEPASLF